MGNISKIICCSLFISTCLYAQIHISGPLSGILVDTVYLVSDDIRVAFGDSLIIWPGATLLFMDTTRFSISGTVYAVGTQEDTISFDSWNNASAWYGLDITNTDTTRINKFSYCSFKSANHGYASADLYGGGIKSVQSKIEVSNSLFTNDSSFQGGGIYLNHSWAQISSSSFLSCFAGEGGGIRSLYSQVSITDCLFENNYAGLGGALSISYSTSQIDNSTLSANVSANKGGGIYGLHSCFILHDLVFNGNMTDYMGGGFYAVYDSVEIANCSFWGNISGGHGGGGAFEFLTAELSECDFINNESVYEGGGVNFRFGGVIEIAQCGFSGNHAGGGGGGLCVMISDSVKIVNSQFQNNHSAGGGGYCSDNTFTAIENSDFVNNSVTFDNDSHGGAVSSSETYIKNCLFLNNRLEAIGNNTSGGAIFCSTGSIIEGCIFSGNYSNNWGGAVCAYHQVQIINCDFYANTSLGAGTGIYFPLGNNRVKNCIFNENIGSSVTYFASAALNCIIEYCDFDNQIPNFQGIIIPHAIGSIVNVNANGDSCDIYYNIYQDPLFVDPVNGNYNLQASSPCIDAGDPNSPPDPDGTIADIGAFYFDQSLPVVQDLVISIEGDDIILNWSAIPIAVSYNIYRSPVPYFDISMMIPIATVPNNSYIDINAGFESVYFYQVTVITD